MTSSKKGLSYHSGLALACIVVGAAAVLTVYLFAVGVPPLYSDNIAYAEPGRQIVQGNGFVSRRLHTALLPFIRDLESRPLLFPYSEQPLFQPWYEALVFTFFGASERTVALANVPLFVLLLLAVFLLTREVFDQWAGFLAAAITLLDPTLLHLMRLGATEIGFMLAVVGAAAVLTVYLFAVGVPPLYSDNIAYAEPGRQIVQGNGFVSRRLHTALLPFIRDLESRPLLFPYSEQPLFQPWYEALVFTFFGASERTVALANVPLFVLLLLAVFLLTREVFDQWAGFLAAAITLLDPTLLHLMRLGATEIGFMLAVVLAFYGTARGAKSGTWGPLFGASAALAWAQYARPVGFTYLVPLLVFTFISQDERRSSKTLLILGLFLLLTLPITIRSWYLFGTGHIHTVHRLLYLTPSFPGYSAYDTLSIPHSLGFMLAVVLAFYGTARGAKSGTWGPLFGASAALAWAQYARPVGFTYLVPLLVFTFISQDERRSSKTLLILGLFLLLTLPITIRSWYLFGTGHIHTVHRLLYLTPSFPGYSAYDTLSIPHSLGVVLARYGWQIVFKWAKWMVAHVVFLYKMTNPATVAAAILGGLWLSSSNRLAAAFAWSLLVAYGLTAATQSVVVWAVRYVSHLVPLFVVLASGAVVAAWRFWVGSQRLATQGFLALVGILLLVQPLATDMHRGAKLKAANMEAIRTFRAFGDFIKTHVGPDEVVATDLSPVVMWYGERTSLTLPMDLETARRVRQEYVPFTAIILTSERIDNSFFVRDETWRRAYRGEMEPLGFAISARFDEGSMRAVLLRPGLPDGVGRVTGAEGR